MTSSPGFKRPKTAKSALCGSIHDSNFLYQYCEPNHSGFDTWTPENYEGTEPPEGGEY